MENTLENKAKFFALYWGQEVLRYDIVDEKSPNSRNAPIDFNVFPEFKYYNRYTIQFGYLLLRPLSQVTDQDLRYLDIYGASVDENGYKFPLLDTWSFWSAEQADYLRSKGYALPWLDTTVERQIGFNWIKLK